MARTTAPGRHRQRKRDTGTFLGELGVTGLTRWGGYVREEFLRELQGKRGIRVYREMRDNDPMVGAVLFAIEQLIRGVEWSVELPPDLEKLKRAAQEALTRAHERRPAPGDPTPPPRPDEPPTPPPPPPADDDGGEDDTEPALTLRERVDALGVLIRSGYDPEDSLRAVGLPAIRHLGLPPITVKTGGEAMAVAETVTKAVRRLAKQLDGALPPAEPDGPLAAAEEIRGFVHGALFEDMSSGWADVVSEILSMLWYGWAYFELVYKLRQGPQPEDSPLATSRFADARWGWRKWSIRAQETLYEWVLDPTGGIQGLRQAVPHGQGTTSGTVFIPIAKALLFRTRSDRNNPEGRSLIRNAYRPWYFKKRIEEVEGIGIERDLAGLPVLKPAEGVPLWDAEDPEMVALKNACERLIRNLKRDEQEGVLIPHDWELTLLTTGSRRQFDTSAIIERYDTRIALTVLADFVLLGHEAIGSWALSSDKTELFAKAVGGFLDMIATTVNRHAIPRLVRMNGWPEALSPRLAHGDLETPDLEGLTNLVIRLGSVTDPVLQRHLRQLAGLPTGETSDPMVGKRRYTTKRQREFLTAAAALHTLVRDLLKRRATAARARHSVADAHPRALPAPEDDDE